MQTIVESVESQGTVSAPQRVIGVKPNYRDQVVEAVMTQLNTEDRKLGFHGKGYRGKFIAPTDRMKIGDLIAETVGLLCERNGIACPKGGDMSWYIEDFGSIGRRLKEGLAKAYDVAMDGRLAREATYYVEKLVYDRMQRDGVLPPKSPHLLLNV